MASTLNFLGAPYTPEKPSRKRRTKGSLTPLTLDEGAAEVKKWRDKAAELAPDPHKAPPTKVVPDDCEVHQEHHHWREYIASLSTPTPDGHSIIDIHPERGASHDEEVAYWKNHMNRLCLSVDELLEADKGVQAMRRRSYEHEEAMFFDKKRWRKKEKRKSALNAEDPMKSLPEYLALAVASSRDDLISSLCGLHPKSMRRLRLNFEKAVAPKTLAEEMDLAAESPAEEPPKPVEEPPKPVEEPPKPKPQAKQVEKKPEKAKAKELLPEAKEKIQGNNNGKWDLNSRISSKKEAMLRASNAPSEEEEEASDTPERLTLVGDAF